jgi:hypothetical protein
VFGSHEKITKRKNQSLANVAGIRQRPVAVAGFRRKSLTGFRPESSGSGLINGQNLPDPGRFGQIRLDQ